MWVGKTEWKDLRESCRKQRHQLDVLERIISHSDIKKQYSITPLDHSNCYIGAIYINGEFYKDFIGHDHEINSDVRELERQGYEYIKDED